MFRFRLIYDRLGLVWLTPIAPSVDSIAVDSYTAATTSHNQSIVEGSTQSNIRRVTATTVVQSWHPPAAIEAFWKKTSTIGARCTNEDIVDCQWGDLESGGYYRTVSTISTDLS